MAVEKIDNLKKLDTTKQLVFAYLTSERLYPNYLYFSKNHEFGNADQLKNIITYIYTNIFNDKPNELEIRSLIAEVNSLTPQPADYDTILASSALDACGVTYETLNFLIDKKSARLDDISTMATDTADMYIQEKENLDYNTDKDFQLKIDTHPLMKREIDIQKGIISYLTKISGDISAVDIDILIQLQENNKGSLNL